MSAEDELGSARTAPDGELPTPTRYGSNADLLERLGSHTTGNGCLYVKRLDTIDRAVLEEMIARSWTTNHIGKD